MDITIDINLRKFTNTRFMNKIFCQWSDNRGSLFTQYSR